MKNNLNQPVVITIKVLITLAFIGFMYVLLSERQKGHDITIRNKFININKK